MIFQVLILTQLQGWKNFTSILCNNLWRHKLKEKNQNDCSLIETLLYKANNKRNDKFFGLQ